MTNSTFSSSTDSASGPAGPPAAATDVIDASQLRQLISEDPLVRVLDVRTGGEFDSVHIPGSYNVPLDTLAEHANDLAELDHPVVLVCKSGARADQAHRKLTGAGKQRLRLLDGGLDAWLASDGDVVRGSSATWAMDRQGSRQRCRCRPDRDAQGGLNSMFRTQRRRRPSARRNP